MRPWIMAVLAPLLFAAGIRAAEEAKPPESAERMVFGTVRSGSVYTAATAPLFIKGDFVDGAANATGVGLGAVVGLAGQPCLDFPPRWKIASPLLLMLHSDTKLFGPVGPREREFSLLSCDLDDLPKKYHRKPKKGEKYDASVSIHGSKHPRVPAPTQWSAGSMLTCATTSTTSTRCPTRPTRSPTTSSSTISPSARTALRTFSSSPARRCRSTWRVHMNGPLWWSQVKNPLKPMLGIWHYDERSQWGLVDQIKDPGFNERFHAFVKGATYFFLTDSGKVYMAKKPDKGERKLESLWDNDHYPITAALEDADTGKVFLFGKAHKGDGDGKDFYWELDETVTRHDYDPSLVKPIDTVEPLKTVMEYARFLADEKRIKLEKK